MIVPADRNTREREACIRSRPVSLLVSPDFAPHPGPIIAHQPVPGSQSVGGALFDLPGHHHRLHGDGAVPDVHRVADLAVTDPGV